MKILKKAVFICLVLLLLNWVCFAETDEKKFLLYAAGRHTVFNYEKIADYYAHATPEMQKFMERSALVVIDFNKAYSFGYIELAQDMANQYFENYGE